MNLKFLIVIFLTFNCFMSFAKNDGHLVESLKIKEGATEKEQQEKLLATEVLVSQSEEKALFHLKALIKKYKNTGMEAGLIFRLAELYMNRAKSARYLEQIKGDGGSVSFLPEKIKNLKERKMVQKAIDHYKDVEKRYPKYEDLDLVLFNKAFAQMQSGEVNKAERSFIKLLRTQKKSKLRPDAFLAVGEINFKKRKFKRSLAYFKRVRKYKDSRVYPYGIYKGAWSYFNLNGYEQAIAELEDVIRFGAKVEKEGKDQRLDLRVEALSDMALFYSVTRSAKEAVDYFIKLSGNKTPVPALIKIAKIYEKHGKDIKQEIVLMDLVKNFKNVEERPFFFRDLTKNFDRQAKYRKSSSSLWAFYKSCKKTMLKNSALDEDYCKEDVSRISRKMSLRWLKVYKENKTNLVMASVSEEAFRVHFSDKKPTDENSKIRFVFAEHLFDLKKYLESSEEYDKVGDSSKDKIQHHQSRYAAVVSYDKGHNSTFTEETAPKYRELSKKYMTEFPKGEKYLDIGFKLGLYDYKNKNHELAAPLLLSLGSVYYLEEKGKKSQDLYLDILNSQNKFIEIQKYSKDWKSKETNVERVTSLQEIFEQAFFSEVEQLEKKKEYRKSLARYSSFIDENPNSKLVIEARWNKIGLHFKLKEFDKTALGYISFYKLHPDNERSIPGLVKAVEIYEMMAEPESAFIVTEILQKTDLKNTTRWGYLSASYLRASGQYEKAAQKFLRLFYVESQFKEISKQDFFALNKQLINTSAWYKDKISKLTESKNKHIASLAVRTYAEGLYKLGDQSLLRKFVRKHKKNSNLKKEDKSYLYFIDGERRERAFFKSSISNKSMDTIVSGIKRKTKSLDRTQFSYQKALEDKDSKIVIQSLQGLSRVYQGFVQELKEMKPPASFSKEESEALVQELDNIIMPFEEKAAEALSQALTVAKESKIKDGSVREIKILFDKVNFEEENSFPVTIVLPNPISPRGFK